MHFDMCLGRFGTLRLASPIKAKMLNGSRVRRTISCLGSPVTFQRRFKEQIERNREIGTHLATRKKRSSKGPQKRDFRCGNVSTVHKFPAPPRLSARDSTGASLGCRRGPGLRGLPLVRRVFRRSRTSLGNRIELPECRRSRLVDLQTSVAQNWIHLVREVGE